MKYVWVVLAGRMEMLEGVFKTREAARMYVRDWTQGGSHSNHWYKIRKMEVEENDDE